MTKQVKPVHYDKETVRELTKQ
ncbi:hypothetical protein KNAG_0L01120 [Huiozyma naganishii CBS 8797]|uniref:Uncharacterized protein n=1 Tax=Huiozyma naganishii (strain ATCC MYA-139 / BCRC 22969 / CBS 8797 / KCTC 17520 / NBRC 10181 / NCYC 3082 / Yp74L-3) TaxID=1071383 RepID=J7S3N6_HUIN7|nr:hypothetical protein KNAG_0L01120 [Kazachstania naganishii CBS 8797]